MTAKSVTARGIAPSDAENYAPPPVHIASLGTNAPRPLRLTPSAG